MTTHFSTRIAAAALAVGALLVGTLPSRAAGVPPMVIQSRYGGPSYFGTPALTVAADFYKAGGGAGSFSTVRAFTSMLGDTDMQQELSKLRAQYGAADVDQFVKVFDFAMSDAWKRAGENNVVFPSAGTMSGQTLADAIVTTGTTDSRYFFTGYLFDKLLTHKVYYQVLDDIDAKYGKATNDEFHRMANQFFVDVAHSVGDVSVLLPKPLPNPG